MELSADNNFPADFLAPSTDERLLAVYTHPHQENRLKSYCDVGGIACYLPLRRALKRHNVVSRNRKYAYQQTVLRPLFPSYLFVRATREQLGSLWRSGSVIRFCGNMETDDELLRRDIRLVRQFELAGLEKELLLNPDLEPGDRFLIESGGVWEGSYGTLISKASKYYWAVTIEGLNGAVIAVEINPAEYKMTRL